MTTNPTVGQTLLLNARETAELMGISERTVWALISEGALRSVRIGRRRLIPRQAIETFIDARVEDVANNTEVRHARRECATDGS